MDVVKISNATLPPHRDTYDQMDQDTRAALAEVECMKKGTAPKSYTTFAELMQDLDA